MAPDAEQRTKNEERWRTIKPTSTVLRSLLFLTLLITALFLSACTSIRPVAKIGLVAPFEGLYRRSGYAALDAARTAINEIPSETIDLLPVALDGTADAERTRRAVRKLLADDGVKAIIGPLSPAMVAQVGDLLDDQSIAWIVPYAVDPAGGFADPIASDEWAIGLVSAVAEAAKQSGAGRLALAGDAAGWPAFSEADWSAIAGVEIAYIEGLDDLTTTDALFWMGSAADGAAFLNRVRSQFPDLPFWLGPQGEDPVFAEHAASMHEVYWSTWVDVAYNGRFSDQSLASPSAYQIYRATVVASQTIADRATVDEVRVSGGGTREETATQETATEEDWSVQLFSFGDDGASTPLPPR